MANNGNNIDLYLNKVLYMLCIRIFLIKKRYSPEEEDSKSKTLSVCYSLYVTERASGMFVFAMIRIATVSYKTR